MAQQGIEAKQQIFMKTTVILQLDKVKKIESLQNVATVHYSGWIPTTGKNM